MPARVKDIKLLRRAEKARLAEMPLTQFAREVEVNYGELIRELGKARREGRL